MIYINIKNDDTVGYMAIVRLPEENNKYAFFNITKNILKPCRFNSEEPIARYKRTSPRVKNLKKRKG